MQPRALSVVSRRFPLSIARRALTTLPPVLCLAACAGGSAPTGPSVPAVAAFADVTAEDALRYVRPSNRVTRPDLVGVKPTFVFETAHLPCPQRCESETWDGTTLTCVLARHLPARAVTLYVVDTARAGANGMVHGAYVSDSISFRGQPLAAAPCEWTEVPATCAQLHISGDRTGSPMGVGGV